MSTTRNMAGGQSDYNTIDVSASSRGGQTPQIKIIGPRDSASTFSMAQYSTSP
jgi:hypothetical protein